MSNFIIHDHKGKYSVKVPTGTRPEVVLSTEYWKSIGKFIEDRLQDDNDATKMIIADDEEMIEMKYGDHPLCLRTFTFTGDDWFGVFPTFELTREQAEELAESIKNFS